MIGLIVKAISGFYFCADGERIYECHARGVFRNEAVTPLVGDHCEFIPEAGGVGTVTNILPRRNEFVRPPIANLDRLFIIAAVKEPTPSPLILDKLTATCESKGVEPVLVITKTDLGEAAPLREVYEKAGFTVCCLNNLEDGPCDFQEELQGRICAFCGNTGVGKSSLLNRICPGLSLETAHISKKLGRGRHTTRHVELYLLPGLDAYVADTPGFGSLEFTGREFIRKEEVAGCFREFAPFVEHCKFTGCSHTAEKGCAVLAALAAGKISRSRWESYVTLYSEAKQVKDWQIKRARG